MLKKDKVRMVIGGFHLQPDDPGDAILAKTRAYFEREAIGMAYPCHCTNLLSKLELSKAVPIGEAGSGTSIEI